MASSYEPTRINPYAPPGSETPRFDTEPPPDLVDRWRGAWNSTLPSERCLGQWTEARLQRFVQIVMPSWATLRAVAARPLLWLAVVILFGFAAAFARFPERALAIVTPLFIVSFFSANDLIMFIWRARAIQRTREQLLRKNPPYLWLCREDGFTSITLHTYSILRWKAFQSIQLYDDVLLSQSVDQLAYGLWADNVATPEAWSRLVGWWQHSGVPTRGKARLERFVPPVWSAEEIRIRDEQSAALLAAWRSIALPERPMFRLQGALKPADYASVLRLRAMDATFARRVGLALLVLTGVIVARIFLTSSLVERAVLAGLALAGLLHALAGLRSGRAMPRSAQAAPRFREVWVNDHEIVTFEPEQFTITRWEEYDQFHGDKEMILLRSSPGIFVPFPRHMFTGDDDWRQFGELVARKLARG